MKAFDKIAFVVLFLLVPFLLQGTEFQVKVTKSEDNLPEKFCSNWEIGDILISDGKYLALIGGVKRRFKTMTNYPSANAMGSIISFVPAGKNIASNLNIGSPIIRIKNKREGLTYSSARPIKEVPESKELIKRY